MKSSRSRPRLAAFGVSLFLLSFVLLVAGAGAWAGRTDAQPCRFDRERFCHGDDGRGGRLVNCLLRHWEELTPACKKELETRGERK